MTNSIDTIDTSGDIAQRHEQVDYLLIDGSGSMKWKWDEVLRSIEAYRLIARDINTRAIAHIFDSQDLEWIQLDQPLPTWPSVVEFPLGAHWGRTPLYDAINLMARRMAAMDPAKAVIVIVTDGQEEGSKHTTAKQAAAMLNWCRAKGWQVLFIGCDFNNEAQAKLLGATGDSILGVRREMIEAAGKLLGEKRVQYDRTGDLGFTDDERMKFGGYLTSK